MARLEKYNLEVYTLLEIQFQRPWVRILHSAEEDNLSPFDLKIACLCRGIEINNNKHVCCPYCVTEMAVHSWYISDAIVIRESATLRFKY